MNKLLIASAALAIGFATASARDRGTIPGATPDGDAISCVRTSNIRSTTVHGDSVIDFKMNNGKVYRNTLPMSCPSLGFEERFLHKSTVGELCSVDIITVLQSPGLTQGPSCGLGKFQPVTLVKTAAR